MKTLEQPPVSSASGYTQEGQICIAGVLGVVVYLFIFLVCYWGRGCMVFRYFLSTTI